MYQISIFELGLIICKCNEALILSPFMDIKGLYMSVCTNFKHFLTLYPLVVNDLLVILPSVQDLQIERSSRIKDGKILDLTSLSIIFLLI